MYAIDGSHVRESFVAAISAAILWTRADGISHDIRIATVDGERWVGETQITEDGVRFDHSRYVHLQAS